MAMATHTGVAASKVLILVGAGLTGSIVLRNGRLSDVLAELQELMKGVNQGEGSSAYDMALIQAQIRHLAQEVRDLTLSKPITILSGKSDSGGSLSSYIVPAAAVGALGYCYMWCKGWSFSDVMFVTKRNMASAVDSMSKQLEQVSSALAATKRHLTKRLENLDGKMDEQVEVSKQIRNEVVDVKTDLSQIGFDVEAIQQMVAGLEQKIELLDNKQDAANAGIWYLCRMAGGIKEGINAKFFQEADEKLKLLGCVCLGSFQWLLWLLLTRSWSPNKQLKFGPASWSPKLKPVQKNAQKLQPEFRASSSRSWLQITKRHICPPTKYHYTHELPLPGHRPLRPSPAGESEKPPRVYPFPVRRDAASISRNFCHRPLPITRSHPYAQHRHRPVGSSPDRRLDAKMSTTTNSSNSTTCSSESESESEVESDIKKMELRKKKLQRYMYVAFVVATHNEKYLMKKERREVRCTGQQWVYDCLGSSKDCYRMFRMHRPCFDLLHETLVRNYGLRATCNMCSEEALGMFLWTVGSPQSVSQVQNRFKRSTETIHRKFNHVLRCLMLLAADIIRPIDPEFRNVHERLQDPKFFPHFNGCIGAIDGTHIPVTVPAKDMINHYGRHGYSSQNVMAVCDFDMRYTSVVAGWPGSAHDTRIFKDTLDKYKEKFPHPPAGKHYLVDSGYPNQVGYLAPFRGTKYHLPEFHMGPAATGREEIFNYLHSSLRNVIERSFAVLKQKWRILKHLPSYPPSKQARIIIACMALHNFIRDSDLYDYHFARCDDDDNYYPSGHVVNTTGGNYAGGANTTMDTTRNMIADSVMAARE